MRVCWIVSDLGHYHAARMRALVASGRHDLHVLQLRGGSGFTEFGATAEALAKIPVRTLFGPGASPATAGKLRKQLYAALVQERPDAVFVNGWSHGSAILAIAWSMSQRIPFVIVSDSTEGDKTRRPWSEFVKRLLVHRASAAFVAGSRHTRYVEKLGMPKMSIVDGCDVVDNAYFSTGADAAKRAAAEVQCALRLPRRYFLGVARFIPRKGLAGLIEAFARFRTAQTATDIDLLMVGDGPERERLEQLAQARGVGTWVRFLGFQQYDVLPSIYGLADALIVPSTTEPWGLVVNEAMASGLPVVVSTACGCVEDLIRDGHNGFVFDPADVTSLVGHLRFIAEKPERRREMGANARADIGIWGLERFVEQYCAAVESAVSAAPRRCSRMDVLCLEAFARSRPVLL